MIGKIHSYLTSSGLGAEIVRSLIGSAGVRIVGMFFAFLVGAQLARALGADGYGVYGLAISILSLAAIPMQFGIPSLLTREIAAAEVRNDWPSLQGILIWSNRTVVMLSLFITCFAAVLLFVIKNRIDSNLLHALQAGLLLMPFVSLGNLRGAALRGLSHIVKGQFPDVVLRPALFSLLLLIVPIFFSQTLNPPMAMVVHTIAAAGAFIAATIMVRAVRPGLTGSFLPKIQAASWWKNALPMAMTEGMQMLYGNLSILLLGLLATTGEVGIFRVASSASLLLLMPVSLLHIVSATFFSRLYAAKDYRNMQRMLQWVAVSMVSGVLIATLPFLLGGEYFFMQIFGIEFGKSNLPLLILSAGTIIGSSFGAGATLLNMTKYERRVTRAFGVSLIVLAILITPFILFWGIVGAALANATASISFRALTWWDARRLLQVDASLLAFMGRDKPLKPDNPSVSI